MKYLKIQNTGELDIRLISLMGGTTKTGNEYKIGRFGTGLKYSLAWLVRNNIDFKIFIGERQVKIHTETEHIQGVDFEVIYIDGVRSSISASTGVDWKGWMICREIYCNAIDEGGLVKEITEEVYGTPNTTTFYLQLVNEIKETIDNWNDYFIHDIEPMYSCDKFAIYPGGKDLRIYKHGVLIDMQPEEHALFHYDIKNASINELREYTGSANYDIFKCLAGADEKIADYALSNMTDQHYEGTMDYMWGTSFSQNWEKAIGNAKLIHQKAVDAIRARGLSVDLDGTITVPKNLFIALTKQFKGISSLRVADKIGTFYESYLPELEAKVKQALTILESCNYFIHADLKFVYGIFEDKTTMAQVSIDKKEILISESLLKGSLFQVVAMLIEENEHYNTGFSDCSRAFQQHWINMFTQKLLEKNEVTL